MELNTKPIKDWFGFTRRERRSTFALLVIVVIIIAFKYTVPDTKITIETDSLNVAEFLPSKNSVISNDPHPTSDNSNSRKPKTSHSLSSQKKQLIEINRCDSAALVELPGIGPILSARIIKYRRLLGGYARIEQLKEVYGLPAETFELIKNRITVDSTFITRININTADYRELSHIRYFEKYELSAILKYRQLKGAIEGMNELIENKIITKEKAEKVRPYLKVGDN
jgi:DNA uptake protein ComE-like DNA-binding protein